MLGWPVARGGSQQIVDAMASYLCTLGCMIWTGRRVESLDDLPPARAVLLDITPRQMIRIAGHRLPAGYVRRLGTIAMVRARSSSTGRSMARSPGRPRRAAVPVRSTWVARWRRSRPVRMRSRRGEHPERPFVLLSHPSLFDPTRAPPGRHTAWGYCHVPHGSSSDMTDRVEAQVERFAPGFAARIRTRHVLAPSDLQRYNANYIGRDINGGVQDLRQLFTRPVARVVPYATPHEASTSIRRPPRPAAGCAGLCGHFAARAVLEREFFRQRSRSGFP